MKTLVIGLFALLAIFAAEVQAQPVVEGSVLVASQYNFRGVAQNDRGVVQPEIDITVPTGGAGTFAIIAWGNIDLNDDTGRAVLPNGNGGHLSEIDFTAAFTRDVAGAAVTVGMTSYNFPNGGSATSEALLTIAGEVFGLSPTVTGFYDFDLFDGFYANGGVARSQELGAGYAAGGGVSLGLTDAKHARAYYGVGDAGLADLNVEGSLSYLRWSQATVSVSIHGSTILDRDKRDALRQAGTDGHNIWGQLTIARSF